MTSKIDSFEIKYCRLISVKFDVSKAEAPKKQAEVNIDLILEHNYIDKDNILHLILGVDVTSKDIVMNISVRHEGLFKFEKKPGPETHLLKTAEITCAAILFPFVRETIADLTRRASLPPLNLDPINFVELYNHNHPKTHGSKST